MGLRLFQIFVLSTIFAGCQESEPAGREPVSEEDRIDEMIEVEERILALTPRLGLLSESVAGHELPSAEARAALFVEGRIPPGGTFQKSPRSQAGIVRHELWTLDGSKSGGLWSEVFAEVEFFENARFYFIEGSFSGDLFDGLVGFEGLGETASGELISLQGKQHLIWEKILGEWRIVDWVQGPLEVQRAPSTVFKEVLDESLPISTDYTRATESIHEANIVDLFTKDKFHLSKQIYADFLDLDSTFQHPGLSVVDYDNDGWDDLYVMGRWGRNQMLHNQRDGTFIDVAARIGLAVNGLCTSAIFADFDNDGDADVFIGRSLERSLYFTNEDGVYRNRTKEVFGPVPLPYLVSTISAVDFNQDGLLDVYFGLYGPPGKKVSPKKWAPRFFPQAMVDEMVRRIPESHPYVNRLGPPNLLLVNRGGGSLASPGRPGNWPSGMIRIKRHGVILTMMVIRIFMSAMISRPIICTATRGIAKPARARALWMSQGKWRGRRCRDLAWGPPGGIMIGTGNWISMSVTCSARRGGESPQAWMAWIRGFLTRRRGICSLEISERILISSPARRTMT